MTWNTRFATFRTVSGLTPLISIMSSFSTRVMGNRTSDKVMRRAMTASAFVDALYTSLMTGASLRNV